MDAMLQAAESLAGAFVNRKITPPATSYDLYSVSR
jgi:hypothetical protein